jgi:hypothetical protein
VLQWNVETLECIRATRPGPTVVARALFVVYAAAAFMKDFGAVMGRFVAAADEAGISQRYTPARDNGKEIGESAFSIARKLWEGG